MGLIKSINGLPNPLRIGLWVIVIGIPAIGLGLIAYDVMTGGNHEDATYKELLVQEVHLCSSLPNETQEKFFYTANLYETETNCVTPVMRRDECIEEPAVGVMQVRACNDVLKGIEFEGINLYDIGCPEKNIDTVQLHPLYPGTGVAYVINKDEAIKHTLGHIIGLGWNTSERKNGHSTRPNSVMHERPGYSFDDIRCDLVALEPVDTDN